MERIMSDEEKLRKAIEISQRRNNNYYRTTATKVNVKEKKDYRLFKKMILQIIICLLIYIIFYLIDSTNYVFSADVIKSTNEILNYDINFPKIYNDLRVLVNLNQEDKDNVENNIVQENEQIIENNINNLETLNENVVKEGEAQENTNDIVSKDNENETKEKEVTDEEEISKTQMEIDAEEVKKICKLLSPLSGTITSEFGEREVTSKVMSADHKGIDIAADKGTKIKSAIAGTVTVAEENSEYGKFIKIVNGDVMTVYAHCQKLKVKVGDKVKIGQTIATVGSTGNSTGPHLHFEIRLENRYINPRLVIEF